MLNSRLFTGVFIMMAIGQCLIYVAHSSEQCRYEIVESMPDKLTFNNSMSFNPTITHEALIEMIVNATVSLRIVSFYMTLTPEPEFADHPSAKSGQRILQSIIDAKRKRNVNVEMILDNSGHPMTNPHDVESLEKVGVSIKYVDMKKLLKNGVLHTKFMIADNQTLYIGSSNFDWRSYSQIKEIGIKFNKCPTLSADLDKIFQTYTYVSTLDIVPDMFPDHLRTSINMDNPFTMNMGDSIAQTFLASSPPDFNGRTNWSGRTDDIDALLSVIHSARHKIDISVMNYGPRTIFNWPNRYWPRIDDALRTAASTHSVQVRLLFSNWTSTKPEEIIWYRSLNALQGEALKGGGIKVKLFQVPSFDDFQRKVPYARVKHDKYMVTDRGVYVGTSNWTPDYFISTCGVSYVIHPKDDNSKLSVVSEMQELFERDFNSIYAHDLEVC